MKKILSSIILGGIILLLTGCNDLENATIYTTVYPISYLTEQLYGSHSTTSSIYPDGTDVANYTLTDKQIETYSNGTLFIYNGTTSEKQIANDFVHENKRLKIIDAAYGLKYKYCVEELWLSPSNYLMLASNIKDGLQEQIGSKYINAEIEEKYGELEETLSIMDAEIRRIAKDAQSRGQETIVVSSNVFKYLEDYGFTVISLEDYEPNTSNLSSLKSNFNSGVYRYILTRANEEDSEVLKELKSGTNITSVPVNMMHTLSEENHANNETYISIMNQYISDLKTITNY